MEAKNRDRETQRVLPLKLIYTRSGRMARVHVRIIRSSLMVAVMAETRLPSRAIRTMMRGIGVKLYFLISTE